MFYIGLVLIIFVVCHTNQQLRMDIAAFLNLDRKIPGDVAKLNNFLTTLPHDSLWGDTQREKGYKAMGELRYHINFSDTYKTKLESERDTETLNQSASGTSGSSGPMHLGGVEIKIECPEWIKLESKARILESAEPKLSRTIQELSKIRVEIGACKNSDGATTPTALTQPCFQTHKTLFQNKQTCFCFLLETSTHPMRPSEGDRVQGCH